MLSCLQRLHGLHGPALHLGRSWQSWRSWHPVERLSVSLSLSAPSQPSHAVPPQPSLPRELNAARAVFTKRLFHMFVIFPFPRHFVSLELCAALFRVLKPLSGRPGRALSAEARRDTLRRQLCQLCPSRALPSL